MSPKKLGNQHLPGGAISGATSWGLSSSFEGKRDGVLLLWVGGPSLPLPHISARCWAPAQEPPKDIGVQCPSGSSGFSLRPPCPPRYLWLLVQRLLVHRRVGAAEISRLTTPEGV